jgi:hypothetical protein
MVVYGLAHYLTLKVDANCYSETSIEIKYLVLKILCCLFSGLCTRGEDHIRFSEWIHAPLLLLHLYYIMVNCFMTTCGLVWGQKCFRENYWLHLHFNFEDESSMYLKKSHYTSVRLYGVTSQETVFFVEIAVIT